MLKNERVVCEVNLDNIAKNVKQIKKQIKNTMLMAIIKADAYGHGAIEVSKTCLYNGANYLGVAILEEAMILRQNNIKAPILILGATIYDKFKDVIKNDIEQTVYSFEMAKILSLEAQKQKKTANIHIKIDTGMGRLGFLPNKETINIIKKINNLPYIKIVGIFSHFAESDKKDTNFTKQQIKKYKWVIDELKKHNIKNFIKHIANSGAILNLQESYFDMVRAGIIIYGIYPSTNTFKNIKLLKAMSLKTQVSFVKKVNEKQSIGYGRTFFTKKESIIATVPVGYADGYSRLLSNKSSAIIKDTIVPIVGNICMDQIMLDVTNVKDVCVGDEVVLIGKSKTKEIKIEDLAKIQNTIEYEIICNISKRVPRMYIKDNKLFKITSYL